MRKGFTLVEVLVVIGITTLLSGVILSYTSSSRDQVALYVEEAKLAQTISRAKSLAIATYGHLPAPCGYGVRVYYGSNSYELFSYGADISCSELPSPLIEDDMVEVVTYKLPPNVRFRPHAQDAAGTIFFLPPDPTTSIWQEGFNATSTDAKIYLTTSQGTAAVVAVRSSGQITF